MRGSLRVIGTACLLLGMLPTIEVRAGSDFNVTLIGTDRRSHGPIASAKYSRRSRRP